MPDKAIKEEILRTTIDRSQSHHEGSPPVPDPTVLTTAALNREIAALKDVIFTRLDGMDRAIVVFNEHITRVPTDTDKQIQHLKELLESKMAVVHIELVKLIELKKHDIDSATSMLLMRIDGMDKATNLLQHQADIFPNRIDEKITALSKVVDERFSAIMMQFRERDVRIEQTSRDSKLAIDAALQAAKEAVAAQNISSALAITKSETSTIKQIDQQGLLIQTATKALDDKIDDLKQRLTRMEGQGVGASEQKTGSQQTGQYVIAIIGIVALIVSIAITILHK